MASLNSEVQDRGKLYKFTKILTLKVAQIVVQSRQGKKISHECNAMKPSDDGPPSSSHSLQWFNLSIPDVPEINRDTKMVLNGEVIEALSNVLCIEIILRTNEGDEMVLEVWTVRVAPGGDTSQGSVSTIYYRMSIMLKSTLSISRITPAYKLSRLQNKDSYIIFHKIYGGKPNLDLLGDMSKTIKVSELQTPIGKIQIDVVYRTKMTILPEDRRTIDKNVLTTSDKIMVKSDHFPKESPRKTYNEKKELDLTKPLTAGAFVDTVKIRELHETLSHQLPPESPLTWLLAEKDKLERRMKVVPISEDESGTAAEETRPTSRPVDVPRLPQTDTHRYTSLMEFPFAEGSPIAELASFYQECVSAREASASWSSVGVRPDPGPSLAQQLQQFEEAVPVFDNMVASMFSDCDSSSGNN
ncbi:autophagy-related protein 13 homolog isoform X1 [Danaus plexippus]|uniref:Autophagy-related protein 13 n=2 Tax=Danaus plexippus TaxID=13037 RepID=A0A212EKI8_DANPL|nr:autophagy-related protein 13 homolog isoform X1 [Danaus plexippus]OWR41996.1 autophagy-related protein 13 [Danaus plexippus plexippus]